MDQNAPLGVAENPGGIGGAPVSPAPTAPPPAAGVAPAVLELSSLGQFGTLTPEFERRVADELTRLRANYTKYEHLLRLVLSWVLLGVVVMFALNINVAPSQGDLWKHDAYAGRYGYTLSLAFVLVPVIFLYGWYRANRDKMHLRPLMRVMRQNILAGAGLWILLDMGFANRFFTFPDERSRVLPLFFGYAWSGNCDSWSSLWRFTSCYPRTIPLEEFIFYLFSGIALSMLYMWAAEDFFSFNTIPKDIYDYEAKRNPPLLHPNKWIIGSALGLVAVGYVIRNFGDHWRLHSLSDGWPLYFLFQMVIVFVPLAVLYDNVKKFTNPQAFLFVMVLTLLIDLIWEATLAIPYGWWGYQDRDMMGVKVTPWSHLPIEAIILWLAFGWTSMFTYEAGKIKMCSGKTWTQVLLGRDTWLPQR